MPAESADNKNKPPTPPTTIVGGRPPEAGALSGSIPRTIEVLLQKAAVDPEFKQRLLEKRGAAAEELGVVLDPAEKALLTAIPLNQLESVIAHTKVPERTRKLLLAGVATLAALGVYTVCLPTLGNTPDMPPHRPTPATSTSPVTTQPHTKPDQASGSPAQSQPSAPTQPAGGLTRGMRPDRPQPKPE